MILGFWRMPTAKLSSNQRERSLHLNYDYQLVVPYNVVQHMVLFLALVPRRQ